MNLLPHQQQAADEFVRRNGRMLLWADTGTGKTATAIECMNRVRAHTTLYLCPSILKQQIANEFARFDPEAAVAVMNGSYDDRQLLWRGPYDVFISNYEQLLNDTDELVRLNPEMIIVDECQRFAAPVSKTLKCFRKLNPIYRLAMSGTPAPNHLHEFWNMTDWVAPGHFYKSFWEFRAKECRMNPAFPQIIGYYDKRKVQERFMAQVHRIRREDVITLPPLTEVRIPCTMASAQRGAYETLKRDMLLELKDGEKLTVPNMLSLIMRLRQMADLPSVLGVDAPSAKVKILSELLESISSRKIICFTEFATVARHLNSLHKDSLAVMGETPQVDRDAIFDQFRTDDKVRILFLTSAAQYGVNLQVADTVIHFDQPWNEARMDQRIARAWRYGQERPVTSYRIIAEKTVDEKMEKMIENKKRETVENLKEFFL